MKIYFHLNIEGFSNCYLVVNEESKEAIIVDPGRMTKEIISQLEEQHLKLVAVLITHNHGSHVHGLKTLRKIYNPKIFAADWEVAKNDTTVITGDGSPLHCSSRSYFRFRNISNWKFTFYRRCTFSRSFWLNKL